MPALEVLKMLLPVSYIMALCRLNALVWYNAWPEHHATLVWEKRFKWIGKWLLCQTGKGDSFETR